MSSTMLVQESPVGTSERPAFENALNWQWGLMSNLSPEWAVGATVSLGRGPMAW